MKYMVLTSALLLTACSSSSNDPVAPQGPPDTPTPVAADGIWTGEVRQSGTLINEINCLITVEDEIGCFLLNPANGELAGGLIGDVSVTGVQISGTGTAYAAFGYELPNGESIGTFSINSGSIDEGETISAVAIVGGVMHSISLAFDELYDRGASLETVSGVYSTFAVEGDMASFSIDPDGSVFSQTASGCIVDGQVLVIDPLYNGYSIDVTMSNCDEEIDGDYHGLGVSADFQSTDDTFLFVVFGESFGLVGAPLK